MGVFMHGQLEEAWVRHALRPYDNGTDLAEKFNELIHSAGIAEECGVKTTIVFTIVEADGKGTAFVIKDGARIMEPVTMADEAQHAANVIRQFACNLLRSTTAG
jgi:hypothetical protein